MEARCNSRSLDDVQVFCVLARNHTSDHRGVLWTTAGGDPWEVSKPIDYYWSHRIPKHRAEGPAKTSGFTAGDVWPKHRAELVNA